MKTKEDDVKNRIGGRSLADNELLLMSKLLSQTDCPEKIRHLILNKYHYFHGDSGFGPTFNASEILKIDKGFNLSKVNLLAIGSGPSGDFNILDLETGRVGWLPISLSEHRIQDLRTLFIPVAETVVDFYWDSFHNLENVPVDYFEADEAFPERGDMDLLLNGSK